jgi:hypothetical protein
MADELRVAASVSSSKGGWECKREYSGVTLDIAGTGTYLEKVIQVVEENGTTAEELLNLPDGGTAGYILVKNKHATNYVEIRNGATGADVIKIRAGGIALFKAASGADLYVLAFAAGNDPAEVPIEITMVEA